ncbi:hypothetical protein NHQ30_007761 [Ciborinia camelliae]|nr:hypothetical protein NHQ30_007761 [Ciborinia camelliae]
MAVDTKILPYFKHLPFTKNFTRFNYRSWEIHDRYKAHQELGDAFILVTPGKNWLQLCNAETLIDINARSREFTRPTEMLEMLNVFGPNLATTEGTQWQLHRKITAKCFNENNNAVVWSEVIHQTNGMRKYWLSKPSINTVADDTRTLSLHVMSSAGFGKSYPFQGAGEDSAATQGFANIRDALKLILDNCLALVALGPNNLDKWWLPKSWKPLHEATVTFKNYMTDAYEEGKQAAVDGNTGGNNLMISLVRASQAETKEGTSQGGLTEQEIYGNIFLFNFAGHDTTANSLAFAIASIATRPDVQDWIAEEINEVLGDQDAETSNYAEIFPRLKRCLAITYETLRLYTPVAIVKTSGPEPRELKVNDSTYVLPPHTMIIPSYSAMHTHPRYWGSNSLTWEPSRWIIPTSTSSSSAALATSPPPPHTSNPATETFLEFPKASNPFIAWSGGARVCPGKKFSQVEFVGVLVGLFREYRVKPVQLEGESEKDAMERLRGLIRDDTGFRLLLQLLHPEKMYLKWEKRV